MREDAVTGEVTRLLRKLGHSEPREESRVYKLLYAELRRIAASKLRVERREHTLTPTALVNEAWLRFTSRGGEFENRNHFLAVAAKVMRRILVDCARARHAECRGGGRQPVSLDELKNVGGPLPDETVLSLEEALLRLEVLSSRAARVVEMRFFAGLTESEVAEVLGVTRRTVNRDWEMARLWLYSELVAQSSAPKASALRTI